MHEVWVGNLMTPVGGGNGLRKEKKHLKTKMDTPK